MDAPSTIPARGVPATWWARSFLQAMYSFRSGDEWITYDSVWADTALQANTFGNDVRVWLTKICTPVIGNVSSSI